jgi:hypothetical protein
VATVDPRLAEPWKHARVALGDDLAGWTIRLDSELKDVHGHTDPKTRTIRVSTRVEACQLAVTLVHEGCHAQGGGGHLERWQTRMRAAADRLRELLDARPAELESDPTEDPDWEPSRPNPAAELLEEITADLARYEFSRRTVVVNAVGPFRAAAAATAREMGTNVDALLAAVPELGGALTALEAQATRVERESGVHLLDEDDRPSQAVVGGGPLPAREAARRAARPHLLAALDCVRLCYAERLTEEDGEDGEPTRAAVLRQVPVLADLFRCLPGDGGGSPAHPHRG